MNCTPSHGAVTVNDKSLSTFNVSIYLSARVIYRYQNFYSDSEIQDSKP